MHYKKEDEQVRNLQLTRDSETDLVKSYFTKVFELKTTGKEYPVCLDDVFTLVYSRKEDAVKVLKSDFIENEDYILLRQNAEQKKRGGHNRLNYWLSVECLEYFIAKRVKPVFEVYRQVFHKTIEAQPAQLRIEKNASAYVENTIITVKMGDYTNQVYYTNGVLYAKLAPIMRFMGYQSGVSGMYVEKLGTHNCIKVQVNQRESWFINIEGFDSLLRMTTLQIENYIISSIFRDVYGIERTKDELDPFTYRYTDSQMLDVISMLFDRPIKREKLIQKLKGGRI